MRRPKMKVEVEIPCPECRKMIDNDSIIVKPGVIITCPHCGHRFVVKEFYVTTADPSIQVIGSLPN